MILCAGEALIDMLPQTTHEGEPAFAPHVGGAVLNTSVALARLDAPSGFLSGISTDLFGTQIARKLTEAGVDISAAHRCERPTTLAFVTLRNGQAQYTFYDENTAGRTLSAKDLPDEIDAEACFFGGISLAVEPCGQTYDTLSERLAPRMPMMLDPNIRPDFIQNPKAYRTRIKAMIARADIVKVSDEDLDWLVGEGTLEDRARTLLELGPAIICLTKGAEGAVALTAGGEVSVPAQRATVVDTVGAGDTFNAGILASLQEQKVLTKQALRNLSEDQLRTALGLGVKAAAITVSRAGANPPTRAEL